MNPESTLNYDDIDWDTLPDEINHTRTHVRELLGSRYGKGDIINLSIYNIYLINFIIQLASMMLAERKTVIYAIEKKTDVFACEKKR